MANNKKNMSAKSTKKAASNKKTNKSKSSSKPAVKSVSKKSANKQTVIQNDKKDGLHTEILSILFIGLALIMIICVMTDTHTGTVGHYISHFLISAFGIGATVLPIVLFVFSLQTLFSKQKHQFKTKLLLFLGFFIVFISLAHIMTRKELNNNTMFYFISYYYEHASLSNGGIVGALAGGTLFELLGDIGSYIILITLLLVLLTLATGKSIVSFINYIGDLIDGVRDEYQDYRESKEYNDDYWEEDYEDNYEDDFAEDIEPKKKRNSKKTQAENDVQLELPIEEMQIESKKKKIKKNNNPSKKRNNENMKVIAWSIPEESTIADNSPVQLDMDFINQNNKKLNEPVEPNYKFSGLNELVNEAEEIRKNENAEKEHFAFNLPEEEKTANIIDNKIEEKTVDIVNDNIEEKTKPQQELSLQTEKTEDLPWFENDEPEQKIAKSALNSINKIQQQEKTPTPVTYSSDNEPEIIEAEKTKSVNKLKVEKNTAYKYPKLDFLGKNPKLNNSSTRQEMINKARQLENTLHIFGVEAKVNNISQGPAVTRYELTPPKGVRVKDIVNLENDIALALAARSIRMEAPIPGKSAIGIEIPNDTISMVYFREVLTNERFQNFKGKLAFGIGKDITGNVIVQDIAKMPHLLIAGSTGSGKSVCINTLITSILYKYSPEQVRLIMIDPKIVELGVYNGIPHLLVPVVTDPQKAAGALNWAVREMMRRYDIFATKGVRNLEGYNMADGIEEKIPQIVVIIDELADLMMVAKKDVEASIQRLTQLARAAGIHLVIATQRPSVNVITGVIKANVPSRIAFKVASSTDSRTILDAAGAEKLLGKGDMLFQAGDMDKPLRIQGAFVTDQEIEQIVSYIKVDDDSYYDQDVIKEMSSSNSGSDNDGGSIGGGSDDGDELINDVISFVVNSGKASTSLIQRKFRIGFNRAARIVDELEDRGIIGPDKGGTKGRDVLMDKYELKDWQSRHEDY